MAGVDEAAAAIRAGKAVILPTDTVYGLCATALLAAPARTLYKLKQRPESEPIAILAADVEMLLDAVPELHGRAAVLARSLLPGPFTLVFPNPARRYRWLTGADPEAIGVRVPELADEPRVVIERAGVVAATSANRHGQADPRRLEDVSEELRAACAAVLDGGELPGSPSTVIDLRGGEPCVLREGAVAAPEALERVWAVVRPG